MNVFALVIYIPDPLGRFLDDLRREVVPHCNPRAHVSVLPPRPLAVDWSAATTQVRALTDGCAPFEVEVRDVRVFPVTDVVYLGIGDGFSTLDRMHSSMNRGTLEFREPFSYHPHITLAQEIPHEDVASVQELACRRWAEYRGRRGFRAERAVFVQNTVQNCWIDLAAFSLGEVTVR